MARRIFIGDIQGCRSELERLLEAVGFAPGRDELHPVGDLVNRGPDSLGCLRLLARLDAGGVLGNHDVHLLGRAAGRRAARPGDTLDDVLTAPDRRELLEWLAERPFVREFSDVLLVHAGLHPEWVDPVRELAGEDPHAPGAAGLFALHVRTCDAHGNAPPREPGGADESPSPYRPWHAFWSPERLGPRTLVFGHWAAQGLLVRPGLRGLDSGCVWGNQLSAWIAEEDRIVQVDAARAYTPT
jgi:bis(5'-nucleosyl)-tetraphosphatase (symmetrical)